MIDIKDISGNPRFSTPINEGSKRKFLLMKEDYITLKFSLANPVYFQLGDGVDNDLGIFELVDLYKPAYNTTTGAYDYELRLDAYYWKWKNKKFFYTPETTGREAGWNLTAPLNVHLNVFLDNLKALGYKFRKEEFTYEIDNTVANTSKLVSYDNVNLIDALTQMAETWECEWWITEHVIHFGRCEYSSPVDFKAGDLTDTENVNVNSMQRSDSQTTYATRVYAFGSTRNIPASYRKSLIFDVKKVDGRDIADTARLLDIKFFPSRDLIAKKTVKGDINIDKVIAEGSQQFKCTVISLLVKGTYSVLTTSVPFMISGITGTGSNEYYPPKGMYNYQLELCYTKLGVSHTVCSSNGEHHITDNTINGFKDTFSLPSSIDIVEDVDNLEAILTLNVQTDATPRGVSARISFNLVLENKSNSANTSVTFLSGSNAGQTFEAVYNPDLLTGDNSNVIRLPEGITASLNDRYTINNIIKGKVPDNYFSKDDKELTLNGVVQKRLMLPEGIPYVDAYRYSPTGERIGIGDERYDNPDNVEMPIEEAVEEIVIFEDEYPKYIGSTTVVPDPTWEDEKVDDKPTGNKYPIYTFKDTGLKNFTKDFLLEELHLIFQTGKLAGLDFALTLKESDNTGTTFEIIRNDDYGRYLPDDILFPQATHMEDGKEVPADTYVLYGFDPAFISEQMMPESEQELLETTKKYVKKSMIDPSTYDCEMDADFIYNNGNIRTYEVGDKINLINRAYFTNGRQSRIIGFEWPLDIPYDHPIYTVGETAAYSRIGEIESKLDNLTYKGRSYSGSVVGGGGTSVYVIGVNDKTLPSDRNVFSSRKSLATFLRKDQEDTTDYLLKLLGGIMTGKIELGDFTPGTLGSGGIIQVDADGKTYLEVDKAYFRMKAIFDSLVIKDAQHVSGEQIITNASIECTKVDNVAEFALYDVNGCELYDINGVQLYSSEKRYRCYFTADDGEQAILSQFVAGDFAMCRQFNIKAGVYDGVSNRYYWRYVMEVGDNYIDLSIEDCDAGSDIPQAGDTIIQLGNRTDVSRQNAIIMSSYGENAPLKQMLQGIDSYSLADKVILEEGFDRVTNQGYTKNYGRSYIGGRDESSYLKYTQKNGVEVKGNVDITGGTIKLQVDDNNIWEVDDSCVNIVGNKQGKHIEINPSSSDIKIFNESGDNTIIIDGNTYDDIYSIFNSTPVEISLKNIPYNKSEENGGGTLYFVDLSEKFKTSGFSILSYTYNIQLINTLLSESVYSKIRILIRSYSNEDPDKWLGVVPIAEYSLRGNGHETYIVDPPKKYILNEGYHEIFAEVGLYSGGAGNMAKAVIASFTAGIINTFFISTYFSNGFVLGTSENNLFSVINKKHGNDEDVIEYSVCNPNYGFRFDNNDAFIRKWGIWGLSPSILCSGRAYNTSDGAGFVGTPKTFDGEDLVIYRDGQGKCSIMFPMGWRDYNLQNKSYVTLTGIGTAIDGTGPVQATFNSWTGSAGFSIMLSNGSSLYDGEFFFEMKLY